MPNLLYLCSQQRSPMQDGRPTRKTAPHVTGTISMTDSLVLLCEATSFADAGRILYLCQYKDAAGSGGSPREQNLYNAACVPFGSEWSAAGKPRTVDRA